MALPDYRYGKVVGLLPDLTVVSERSESPMVCCGYCSAHMAALTARTGLSTLMKNEAHAIRAAGGRPHNHGNSASELRAGALKALGVTLKSVAIADIPERLRTGHAVTAGCQYADLPGWLKVQTNDFGHAVCLFGWKEADDLVGFFDPLWDQGARGAWAPWPQVRNALWPNGNHSTTTARLVSMGGDFIVYAAESESRKRGDVAGNTPFYNDWKLTDKRGTIPDAGTRAQIYGYRGEALAIEIKTAQGYSDGVGRNTMVYVNKSKVTNIATTPIPVPPTTPPPVNCDDQVTAAVMARDDEWEQALMHGEKWPGR